MLSRWEWLTLALTRQLWFRSSLISLLAIAAALVAFFVGPYIPADIPAKVGADSVNRILGIISTSMLAVTTFSLSTMVAAYSAATSTASPRATKLLIEDSTTQNVLATFVGSFLYSLVSIILLSTGVYGAQERLVLFAVTLVVIILIVLTLLRWIDYLLRLGRVGETAEQVELAVSRAMRQRARRPCLGGRELTAAVPKSARPIFSEEVGYVQHVDMNAIAECAEDADGKVYLGATPGMFVDPGLPLAFITGKKDEDQESTVRSAFSIGRERSFDQDPRFGFAVLSEIASRALSPAVNDPGTAIDIIGRAVRTYLIWAGDEDEEIEPEFERVLVPPVDLSTLFEDFFTPVARDGATMVEVQVRLQQAFAALARCGDTRFHKHALRYSRLSLRRASDGLAFAPDLERVKAAAKAVGADA